jgi:arabinose-5-phosphate isomerase
MTKDPKIARPDQLASEALEFMNSKKVSAAMVVDAAHTPIGILRIHDILRAGVA